MLARLEDDLPTLVAEEVASLLAVGQRLTVGALVDADDVAALISDVLERVPPSTAASTFTAVLAEVLHAGPPGGEEHTLGDVVSREHVEALTDAALAGTDTLKDALDDLTRSPAVAAVAGRFMARVVSEVVQTNRAMAEKLPGLGSLGPALTILSVPLPTREKGRVGLRHMGKRNPEIRSRTKT